MTHTYVILEVSKETYQEIRLKLENAGYEHAFSDEDGKEAIDMTGIALAEADE